MSYFYSFALLCAVVLLSVTAFSLTMPGPEGLPFDISLAFKIADLTAFNEVALLAAFTLAVLYITHSLADLAARDLISMCLVYLLKKRKTKMKTSQLSHLYQGIPAK